MGWDKKKKLKQNIYNNKLFLNGPETVELYNGKSLTV